MSVKADGTPLRPVRVPEPLEEEALLRQLLPRFSTERTAELHQDSLRDYTAAIQDREEWESNLKIWDDQYYGNLPQKDFPWEGSSNLHVPLTMLGVETLKPRLIESVLGEFPPVLVQAVEQADEELRSRVELFFNWQIQTEVLIDRTVPLSAHLFLNPGIVVAKTSWQVTRRKRKYIRKFPLGTPSEAIFQAIFGGSVWEEMKESPTNVFRGRVADSPNVPPKEVSVTLLLLKKEIAVLVEKEDIDERPAVDLIDPLDFIVPVRGSGDVQKLPWVMQRLWLTEDELRRRVILGRFYPEVVRELLGETEPGEGLDSDHARVQENRDAAEGTEGTGESSARQDEYPIIEEYRGVDVNRDGFLEEIVLWWSPDLPDQLLGWDYLDNLSATGLRPYVVGRFLPIPFRFYPLSFPEMVRSLQEETNTIHNQRVDYGTLQNLPWGFVRASAMLTPMTIRVAPGRFIPIGDPSDVNIPHFQGSAAFGQAEEALNYQYFERLTGLTDLALGRQPTRVGATRTATGVASLLSESGLRFKTVMRAFQQFWTEIFQHLLALDQQYLPPGREFRVTGRVPEVIRLRDRFDIAGRFDLRLSANTDTLNREIRREDATIILQSTLNPALIQGGIIGMKGVRRSLEDFYKAYNRDPDAYLEPDAGLITRSPVEELALVAEGQPIRPSPVENLPLHIETHMAQLQDPAVVEVLGAEGRARLEKHVNDTLILAQSQLVAQTMQPRGPQAQVGPQAQNAQIGRTAPSAQPTARTTLPVNPEGAGGMIRGG